jgi:hypothetical protein
MKMTFYVNAFAMLYEWHFIKSYNYIMKRKEWRMKEWENGKWMNVCMYDCVKLLNGLMMTEWWHQS